MTKEPISDEGLQVVEGRFHGGGPTFVRLFRVALVSCTLMSLSQMVEEGIKVVFDSTAGKNSSHIVIKKCGVKILLVKKNKVHVLPWRERHVGFQPAGSRLASPNGRRLCFTDCAGECEASSNVGERYLQCIPRWSLQELLRRRNWNICLFMSRTNRGVRLAWPGVQ